MNPTTIPCDKYVQRIQLDSCFGMSLHTLQRRHFLQNPRVIIVQGVLYFTPHPRRLCLCSEGDTGFGLIEDYESGSKERKSHVPKDGIGIALKMTGACWNAIG